MKRPLLTLGLAGGLDPVHSQILDSPENYTYDGAAVLLADGVVVAAVEEERLNRIKHSNKFPVAAIRFCLSHYGATIADIDHIAYYVDEAAADGLLALLYLERSDMPRRLDARTLLQATIARAFDCAVDPARLRFYEHRLTHAACAMHQSGFADSLVYVIDNAGGLYRGRRAPGGTVDLDPILLTPPAKSIQKLCHAVLPHLGLTLFEEYKALALAGQGDPARFATTVGALYELLPEGDYRLRLDRAGVLIDAVAPPRGEPPSQAHYDLAAALQAAMERIVLHVLEHHRRASGLRTVCMAGGMAENIATNGAVLRSGLFDDVFVHPVAHDAGCALGAALLAAQAAGCPSAVARVASVGWGSAIGDGTDPARRVAAWPGLAEVERCADPPRYAADRIADGALVGWVRGRSDFGTHALGSRNVFARAEIAANRERLHQALGRPERYRPLAALVRAEDLGDWCVLPPGIDALPFQTFAVEIRDNRRAALAGAMCPDGTACVQSVVRDADPALWRMLTDLGARTSTPAVLPAVLSASFNRSSEPTVETLDDAIACFLDSGIDHLVVGDIVAAKAATDWDARRALRLSLPPHVQMLRTSGWIERSHGRVASELRTATSPAVRRGVTPELAALLGAFDDDVAIGDLLTRAGLDEAGERALIGEIGALWSAGLIRLRPPAESIAA